MYFVKPCHILVKKYKSFFVSLEKIYAYNIYIYIYIKEYCWLNLEMR